MTKDEIIRRGTAAARLLGDETLTAALAEIEHDCIQSWTASNPSDVAGREDAYRLTRCVGLIRQKLETWRGAGQVESNNAQWRLSEARTS